MLARGLPRHGLDRYTYVELRLIEGLLGQINLCRVPDLLFSHSDICHDVLQLEAQETKSQAYKVIPRRAIFKYRKATMRGSSR